MSGIKPVSKTRKTLKVIGWILLCLSPIYILPLLLLMYISYNELLAAVAVRPMAKEYIAETYPDADMYVADAGFDFKGNSLYAKVQSSSSTDTHFKIWYDMGWPEYIYDTSDNIASGVNTFIRLQNEYNRLVQNASLDVEHLYTASGTLLEYDPEIEKDGLKTEDLILDTEFNMLTFGAGYGYVRCRFLVPSEHISHEYAEELIAEYDRTLSAAGIHYKYIEFWLFTCDENGEPNYSGDYINIITGDIS